MEQENIVKDFLKQYNAANAQIKLPEFLKDYQILSCTYEKAKKSCYLAANRETDQKYLLKICSNDNAHDILKTEYQKLCQLAEAYPDEYQKPVYQKENEVEYLLRHYIPGMDLETYQEQCRELSIQVILRITVQLCEIVEKLHILKPSLLHRDIKPQNLIIDDNGRLHLIDFETARNYSANKSKDTLFFGTEGNAAPEQYGYSQSDARTDVYGIGKVLDFLYRENSIYRTCTLKTGKKLKKIIVTATAFDPAHRYQSVSEMKYALKKVLHKADEKYLLKKVHIIAIAEAASAVLLICASLFFTKIPFKNTVSMESTDGSSPDIISSQNYAPQNVEENTDLDKGTHYTMLPSSDINDIAKIILGKKEITDADYKQITQIAVIGNQIYEMGTDLEKLENDIDCLDFNQYLINGGITDLSLLAKMKNLKEVCLCNQNITDISPLKGLPIEKLYLSGNQISDFSVLKTLKELRVLFIVDNPISVLPDISGLNHLISLNLSGNVYENLDFLNNSTVGYLDIRNVIIKNNDFSVLPKLLNLTKLGSADNQPAFYEELPKIRQLTELGIWGYREKNLSIISSLPNLKRLFVSGDSVNSLSGIEKAPNLRQLHIDGTNITDLSGIEKQKALTYIRITGNAITDYAPLFQCTNLVRVYADSWQKKEIEKINPSPSFEITNE